MRGCAAVWGTYSKSTSLTFTAAAARTSTLWPPYPMPVSEPQDALHAEQINKCAQPPCFREGFGNMHLTSFHHTTSFSLRLLYQWAGLSRSGRVTSLMHTPNSWDLLFRKAWGVLSTDLLPIHFSPDNTVLMRSNAPCSSMLCINQKTETQIALLKQGCVPDCTPLQTFCSILQTDNLS